MLWREAAIRLTFRQRAFSMYLADFQRENYLTSWEIRYYSSWHSLYLHKYVKLPRKKYIVNITLLQLMFQKFILPQKIFDKVIFTHSCIFMSNTINHSPLWRNLLAGWTDHRTWRCPVQRLMLQLFDLHLNIDLICEPHIRHKAAEFKNVRLYIRHMPGYFILLLVKMAGTQLVK